MNNLAKIIFDNSRYIQFTFAEGKEEFNWTLVV